MSTIRWVNDSVMEGEENRFYLYKVSKLLLENEMRDKVLEQVL